MISVTENKKPYGSSKEDAVYNQPEFEPTEWILLQTQFDFNNILKDPKTHEQLHRFHIKIGQEEALKVSYNFHVANLVGRHSLH